MISDERTSKAIDIPKKRKYHQDNLGDRVGEYNLPETRNGRHASRRFQTKCGTIDINTAATLKPTKTAWRVQPCKINCEKLKNVNSCGRARMAKDILTSMVNEELDEGEMADTEDIHVTTWRKHQSMRGKNKYRMRVAEIV
ncbi:hypothetical protein BCIN_12g00130 [Botrytis cinerea B05.10]|uniref:Uncharacterized protein n=1 Tax=Botryotinia fuckeliana (strain B05.10) TaxID=332648 RepID=A0A384JYG9_BOTFB|nr:hypothetical protein BCIN_12g00130 [Botrytis cinerea B05.10]ATZ55414.1 hypothetical protein BCIN_12g00130 [Botrytis cinerea B05.10]